MYRHNAERFAPILKPTHTALTAALWSARALDTPLVEQWTVRLTPRETAPICPAPRASGAPLMGSLQMAQELDLKTMDRRLVDRLVRRGEVSEKELEKTLKQLPDVAEEGAAFESKLEGTDSQG